MDNPYWQAIQNWWQTRQQREQLILIFLGIFIIFLLFYRSIWEPVRHNNQQANNRLYDQMQQWQWIQQQSRLAKSLQSVTTDRQTNRHVSLSQKINKTAQKHKIPIERFQQITQNKIIININKVVYSQLINWLQQISQQQVILLKVQIKRLEQNGWVSAKLTLGKA